MTRATDAYWRRGRARFAGSAGMLVRCNTQANAESLPGDAS